ncbi:hypothetical protein Tco_0971831 [Tanacetum coccineum]
MLKSSTHHSFVNEFVVINIPEEDVKPKQIILDPDDQPMWESAKTVAPTPNSAIIQLDVDDNFVINSTHLNMIRENKFDGYLWADPHDHVREFLTICNMFGYGETQSETVKLLIFPFFLRTTQEILDVTAGGIFLYKSPNQAFQLLEDKVLFEHDCPIKSKNKHHQKSVSFADGSNSNNDNSRLMEKLEALTIKMDSQIISLNEKLQDMREKYNELRNGNASKNHMNDDTPMCERHEANYIQSEELNNDVRNDLEDFKRCIRSMRTVHWKPFSRDDGKTTGVLPMKKSKPINQDLNMKQNEKNFQTKIKNMERKIVEWSKSQNISLEQTDRTEPPPPPQAQTEHVNAVFTGSGKSDDSLKIQKDPPPPIIIKIEKDKPIKTSKKGYHVVKTNKYPFREYIPKTPYPQRLNMDHSHLNRIVKVS